MITPPPIPADLGARHPVQMVALDVDGTVLNPEHQVSPATRHAVAAARAAGITVVLASSRSPHGLRPILDELDLADQWFVGYQGAVLARWTGADELQVLTETRLDQGLARQIERSAADRFSVSRYSGVDWRVTRLDPAIEREAAITGERPIIRSQQGLDTDPAPHKILIIAGEEHLVADLDEFAQYLPSTVTATFSHRTYLEITAAGVDKATALVPLAAYLGIPLAEVAAVGDGLNDLAMFAAVGLPIAMGQASAAVQAAAAHVTGSNRTDGAAQALRVLVPTSARQLTRRHTP